MTDEEHVNDPDEDVGEDSGLAVEPKPEDEPDEPEEAPES